MGNKKLQLDVEKSVKEKLNEEKHHDGDVLDTLLFHVGDMGRYQKLLCLMMLPLGFTYAFVYFVQMFITVTPQNHWCRVPELANLSMELRRNLSAPATLNGDWDHCRTYDTNWSHVLKTLSPPAAHTPTVPCRHGWEFDLTDVPYHTVASEREWVCDDAKHVPTAQSMFFVGSVLGSLIFGWAADRFGRVPAIIGANLVGGIGGVATIFTTGVWDFVLCRFLVGLAFDNCFMMLYIMVLEYVGPQYRTLVANLVFALSFGVAAVALPWMAYFIANWRILLWVTSLPMFIVLLAPWLIPESVRWLMSRGRVNDVMAILRKFEAINGTKIPGDVVDDFLINKNLVQEKQSFLSLLKSPPLRNAIISLMVLYMGCAIVFDGLVRLSDTLGLNFFVVFSFLEGSELISILVVAVILDRFGRRNVCVVPMVAAGLMLFIALFVPSGLPQVVLDVAARSLMNTGFTTLLQWTTEILPTPFRASGCSILHMCAFVATVFTPFIVYSERLWKSLPLVIFTGFVFVTAGVGLTLPETKGLSMPQTVADGERIIKENSFWRKREETAEQEKMEMQ